MANELLEAQAQTDEGHGVAVDPGAELPPGTITAHGIVGPDGRAPATPEATAEAVLGPPPAELPRLSREQLLSAPDRPELELDVPEWGGSVKLRALSLGAFRRIQAASAQGGEMDGLEAMQRVIVEAIVEPELGHADVAALGERSVAPVVRVAKAIVELSGLDGEFVQAAEAAFRR